MESGLYPVFVVRPETCAMEPLALFPPVNPVLAIFFEAKTNRFLVAEYMTIDQRSGFLPIDTAVTLDHANSMVRMMLESYLQGDQAWREWRRELSART